MDIYKSERSLISSLRKKKVDLFFMGLFVFCVLIFLLAYIFVQQIKDIFSSKGYDLYSYFLLGVFIAGAVSIVPVFIVTKTIIIKIISGALLLVIVIPLVTYLFIISPFHVRGFSMTPTLLDGYYILGSALPYQFGTPHRGDIVIYKFPGDESGRNNVARIVGMPGENISIRDGVVYLNSKALLEPYLSGDTVTLPGIKISETVAQIPDDEYAILGDNRSRSFDSRQAGFIKRSLIEKKVLYIYWPTDRRGFIKSEAAELSGFANSLTNTKPSKTNTTCTTLGTKMIVGADGGGEIGCDIQVTGDFKLSESYCESQKTRIRRYLVPDAYNRPDRYYTTLTGLYLSEEVKVFVTSLAGLKIECLPSLNNNVQPTRI